jgi:hypothetical protein
MTEKVLKIAKGTVVHAINGTGKLVSMNMEKIK